MNIEIFIIRLIIDNKEIRLKYSDFFKEYFSTNLIYKRLVNFLLQNEFRSCQDSFVAFYTMYPALRPRELEEYSDLFKRIQEIDVSKENIEELVKTLYQNYLATKIAEKAINKVGADWSNEVFSLSEQLRETKPPETGLQASRFVSTDLGVLLDQTYSGNGLEWPVEALNRSLGPLRPGDFGYLFARPETGKTTFIAHVVSHILKQIEGEILWVNNEEQGEKVMLRFYESLLGLTLEEIRRDLDGAARTIDIYGGNRLRLVDGASISFRDIDRLVEEILPKLVVIDQLDKVEGFDEDRNDLELGAIYRWGRELAKKFKVPVIGVSQASATAENKRWLDMGDAADSRTSKQAEADFVIGIGKVFEPGFDNIRFINICKNKLLGGPRTDPALRHARLELFLNQEIARYEDTMKWA